MQEPQILKNITPEICPHCGKELLVSLQVIIPQVVCVSSREQLLEVKKTIKERIAEIKFADENDRLSIYAQLDDEQALLDTSDIEGIVNQNSREQAEKISKKNTNENTKKSKN